VVVARLEETEVAVAAVAAVSYLLLRLLLLEQHIALRLVLVALPIQKVVIQYLIL
jgi:hypothetical protein